MIYKNQSLLLTLDTGENVSTATTKQILYIKADGVTKGAWTASSVVDNTKLRYQVPKNILTVGTWKVQTFVVMPSADEWFGEVIEFRVEDNIAA